MTQIISGSFATGFISERFEIDSKLAFREFVIEIADDLGLSEAEVDEQLELLIQLRRARREERAHAAPHARQKKIEGLARLISVPE